MRRSSTRREMESSAPIAWAGCARFSICPAPSTTGSISIATIRSATWRLEFRRGLDGLSESETRSRLVKIERLITEWSKGRKLYGHLYDDLLKLKYLHQRYTNYLRWLKTQ